MKKEPLVSIVMPVYNTEKFLGEAIESILNQTYTNFEFLIIDDGSTDGSFKIIQNYSKKDKRIKFISRENIGLVRTRNELLQMVSTESTYIGILDSDDFVTNDWLTEAVGYLNQHKFFSTVSFDITYIDKNSTVIGNKMMPLNPEEKKRMLLTKNPLSHGGSLVRKSDWMKIGYYYDNTFSRAHDYELWSRFIGNDFNIAGIQKFLYTHRITGGQQGKRKFLKKTLINDIRIKARLLYAYKMKITVKYIYTLVLYLFLLLLPSFIIYWIFTLTVKNA